MLLAEHFDAETRAAFWSKVVRTDGCWEWTAGRCRDGYGRFALHGRSLLAHRASYVLSGRRLDDASLVLHHCDNPPCVRPDHLFCGSQTDNMRDMAAKSRGPVGYGRGAAHPLARLSPSSVKAIRQLRASGRTYSEIASQFGIGIKTARDVLTGRTWSHVQ